MSEKKWKIIGLMSGTSLDGLDVSYNEFVTVNGNVQSFKLIKGQTFTYSDADKQHLNVMNATAMEFAAADFAFGKYCGEKVLKFVLENQLQPDFVASHGHTIFHQPANGFTTQIGNGAAISAACNLPVVSDFRTMDVALGGQGAPLVPIGDLLLFKDYQYCLNLGGIANISSKEGDGIKAFDICPANMALNLISKEKGLEYDPDGNLARTGTINKDLLEVLNSLGYYQQISPKSLGKEWFDTLFFPLLSDCSDTSENKLRTLSEHIAIQIAAQTDIKGEMLVTGGGAFNKFLIERISYLTAVNCKVVIPDKELVGYKEALIFAFLGLLRVLNQPNAITSVTGARVNSIGGALYGDISKLKI